MKFLITKKDGGQHTKIDKMGDFLALDSFDL